MVTLPKDRHFYHRHRRRCIVATLVRFCVIFVIVPIIEMDQSSSSNTTANTTNTSSSCHGTYGMRIMSTIVQDKPLPAGYTVSDNKTNSGFGPKARSNDWGSLVNHHTNVLTITILVGIIVFVIPIMILIFFIFRYFYRRYGRQRCGPIIQKHGRTLRIVLTVLLLLLAIGVLSCVVILITANSYFYIGLRENRRYSAFAYNEEGRHERYAFLTYLHINHTLVTNYRELTDNMYSIINDTSYIDNYLKNSPTFITNFNTQSDLKPFELMSTESYNLRSNATQLFDMTRSIKRDLLELYESKASLKEKEVCVLGNESILSYPLPQILKFIENIAEYNTIVKKKLTEPVIKADNFLEPLKKMWYAKTVDITNALQEAAQVLSSQFSFSSPIKQPTVRIKKTDIIDDFRRGGEYATFRFFTSIIVCTVLLMVSIGLVTGLLCGLCGLFGRRPERKRYHCCNPGTGALLLLLTVALILIFGSLLALIALTHFLQGIILFRMICQPLEPTMDTTTSKPTMDTTTPKPTTDSSSSQLINACRENKSIQDTLNIQHILQIGEIQKVNQQLDKLDEIKIQVPTIKIDKPTDISDIKWMAQYDLGTMVKDLNRKIAEEEQDLKKLIDELGNGQLLQTLSTRHQVIQNYIINPMKEIGGTLKILYAKQLQLKFEYNKHTFPELLDLVLSELKNLPDLEQDSLIYKRFLRNEFNNYTDMVSESMRKQDVTCYTIANIFKPQIIVYGYSTCCDVVKPFIIFCVAALYCILFLMLPILILAFLLASLDRKSKSAPLTPDDRSSTLVEKEPPGRNSTLVEEEPRGRISTQEYPRNSTLRSISVYSNEPARRLTVRGPFIQPRASTAPKDESITIHVQDDDKGGKSNYTRVTIGPEGTQTRRSTIGGPLDRRLQVEDRGGKSNYTRVTIGPEGTQTRRSTIGGPLDRRLQDEDRGGKSNYTRVTIGPEGTQTRRSTIGGPLDRRLQVEDRGGKSNYTRVTIGPEGTQTRRSTIGGPLDRRLQDEDRGGKSNYTRVTIGPEGTQTRRSTIGGPLDRRLQYEDRGGKSNYTRVTIGPEGTQTRRSTIGGPLDRRSTFNPRESIGPRAFVESPQDGRVSVTLGSPGRRITLNSLESNVRPQGRERMSFSPPGRRSNVPPRAFVGPSQERGPRESISPQETRRESIGPPARRSTNSSGSKPVTTEIHYKQRKSKPTLASSSSSDLEINIKSRKSKND